ncbi:MAG: hypothetical protein HY696_07195 [Deltaproteobacteria bacterium]|nr:hypothetical protein [Deltaproteobacteria bacterium]
MIQPARQALLTRVTTYFDRLSTDRQVGFSAETLTSGRFRTHWATRVRPAEHPWMREASRLLSHAARGDPQAATAAATALLAQKYSDRGPQGHAGLRLWAAVCRAPAGAIYEPIAILSPLALALYPQLPAAYAGDVLTTLPLLTDMTVRCVPSDAMDASPSRALAVTADYCIRAGRWLADAGLAWSGILMTSVPAEQVADFAADCVALCYAILGRILLEPDAISEASLCDLFSDGTMEYVLWATVRNQGGASTTHWWYEQLKARLVEKVLAAATPQGKWQEADWGATVAHDQGDGDGEAWFLRQRGEESPASVPDPTVVPQLYSVLFASTMAPSLAASEREVFSLDVAVAMRRDWCRRSIPQSAVYLYPVKCVALLCELDQLGPDAPDRTEWEQALEETLSAWQAATGVSALDVLTALVRAADNAEFAEELIVRQLDGLRERRAATEKKTLQ